MPSHYLLLRTCSTARECLCVRARIGMGKDSTSLSHFIVLLHLLPHYLSHYLLLCSVTAAVLEVATSSGTSSQVWEKKKMYIPPSASVHVQVLARNLSECEVIVAAALPRLKREHALGTRRRKPKKRTCMPTISQAYVLSRNPFCASPDENILYCMYNIHKVTYFLFVLLLTHLHTHTHTHTVPGVYLS